MTRLQKKRIFQSIDKAQMNNLKSLREEYQNVKMKLGRRPKLTDFDKYGELDPLRIIACKKSYHNFLVSYDNLDETFSE